LRVVPRLGACAEGQRAARSGSARPRQGAGRRKRGDGPQRTMSQFTTAPTF